MDFISSIAFASALGSGVIFSAIPVCKVFADVGCDHGYIAKAMLDEKKCQKAIISDVSEKCLKKAETLLHGRILSGECEAVVSNGFQKVGECDTALIAGMGGEEIISIINNAKELPKTLVLQPMKNLYKVRKTLVEKGFKIQKDYVFFAENKFYDLIVAIKGKDFLTKEELEFGRDNIINSNPWFKKRNAVRLALIEKLLSSGKLGGKDKDDLKEEMERLKKYV